MYVATALVKVSYDIVKVSFAVVKVSYYYDSLPQALTVVMPSNVRCRSLHLSQRPPRGITVTTTTYGACIREWTIHDENWWSWWEKICVFMIDKLLLPLPVVVSFVEDSMCPVLPTIWLRLSEQTWFSRVCTKGKEGERKSWEGESCWTWARRRRVSRATRNQLWICWDMLAMMQTLVFVFFCYWSDNQTGIILFILVLTICWFQF